MRGPEKYDVLLIYLHIHLHIHLHIQEFFIGLALGTTLLSYEYANEYETISNGVK